MTETLTTSGAVKLKAGAKAQTLTAQQYTDLINQAEGFYSATARYDWVANYNSLSSIGKTFLDDGASSWAALKVINYDMSGFTSKEEAQTMLDVNWNTVRETANLLRDEKFRTFIQKGAVE